MHPVYTIFPAAPHPGTAFCIGEEDARAGRERYVGDVRRPFFEERFHADRVSDIKWGRGEWNERKAKALKRMVNDRVAEATGHALLPINTRMND